MMLKGGKRSWEELGGVGRSWEELRGVRSREVLRRRNKEDVGRVRK